MSSSRAERARRQGAIAVFSALDRNRDGELAQEEVLVFAHHFSVSWREAKQVLGTLLAAADKDGDGALQPEEWVRASHAHARMI